jgi:A/G-specific adenine glycosylase
VIPILRIERIQKRLLHWFGQNGRDLPWRKARDPYAIWISEVMLQQTRVVTVIPYYQRFLKSFPTVHHLAKSDLSKVLKIWEGLGYYSRARNLHRASRIILNHFKGKLPDHPADLLKLPGIGKYTAGAILSIAYNKEAPILDGNVKRVLSRLFGISGHGASGKAEGLLWKISGSLIPKGRSNSFNQAIMDLGAMICTPKDPSCHHCPLLRYCKAKASGNPEKYPPRGVKKRIPHIEAISGVILRNGKVLLNQRPPTGLLGGLWEFPNWRREDNGRLRLRLRDHVKKEMGMNVRVKEPFGIFKQTFTHFKLTLRVFNCESIAGRGKGKWVPIKDLDQFAMSRINRRIAQMIDGKTRG